MGAAVAAGGVTIGDGLGDGGGTVLGEDGVDGNMIEEGVFTARGGPGTVGKMIGLIVIPGRLTSEGAEETPAKGGGGDVLILAGAAGKEGAGGGIAAGRDGESGEAFEGMVCGLVLTKFGGKLIRTVSFRSPFGASASAGPAFGAGSGGGGNSGLRSANLVSYNE